MAKLARIATLTVLMALGATAAGRAQSGSSESADSKTYRWFGEFVSVDRSGMTMTVKPRIAYQEAIAELKQFKPGDPVWIVWSGISDYSDAVRQVRRADANRTIAEDLVLPAELVSTDAANQYLTIRVKVPQRTVAALEGMKAGEWVTVTSRHRPATDREAVLAVKPYGSTELPS